MVATAILDNSKIRNFNVDPLKSPRCTTVPNFIKIDRAVVEIGDLTALKMAIVCHLGFLKFRLFNSQDG